MAKGTLKFTALWGVFRRLEATAQARHMLAPPTVLLFRQAEARTVKQWRLQAQGHLHCLSLLQAASQQWQSSTFVRIVLGAMLLGEVASEPVGNFEKIR